jgi:hypothetical protein
LLSGAGISTPPICMPCTLERLDSCIGSPFHGYAADEHVIERLFSNQFKPQVSLARYT